MTPPSETGRQAGRDTDTRHTRQHGFRTGQLRDFVHKREKRDQDRRRDQQALLLPSFHPFHLPPHTTSPAPLDRPTQRQTERKREEGPLQGVKGERDNVAQCECKDEMEETISFTLSVHLRVSHSPPLSLPKFSSLSANPQPSLLSPIGSSSGVEGGEVIIVIVVSHVSVSPHIQMLLPCGLLFLF